MDGAIAGLEREAGTVGHPTAEAMRAAREGR
jgi:hypothetical protein